MNLMAIQWIHPSGLYNNLFYLIVYYFFYEYNNLFSLKARYKEGNYGEAEQHFYIPEQVSVYEGNLVINSTKFNFVVSTISLFYLFFIFMFVLNLIRMQ